MHTVFVLLVVAAWAGVGELPQDGYSTSPNATGRATSSANRFQFSHSPAQQEPPLNPRNSTGGDFPSDPRFTNSAVNPSFRTNGDDGAHDDAPQRTYIPPEVSLGTPQSPAPVPVSDFLATPRVGEGVVPTEYERTSNRQQPLRTPANAQSEPLRGDERFGFDEQSRGNDRVSQAPYAVLDVPAPVESRDFGVATTSQTVGVGDGAAQRTNSERFTDSRQLGSTVDSGQRTQTRDNYRQGNSPFLTLLVLFASIGLNIYLGWISWDTYNRYQDLVADVRYTSSRRTPDYEVAAERSTAMAEAGTY